VHTRQVIQKKRIIYLVAGLLVFLTAFYAVLPGLLAVIVRQQLESAGMAGVRLEIGYPGLHTMQIRNFNLTLFAGGNQFDHQIPEITLEYSLVELLSGRLAAVRIPSVDIQGKPDPNPPESSFNPAIILSGQWLGLIPVNVLRLDKLQFKGHLSGDLHYAHTLSINLQAGQFQLQGSGIGPAMSGKINYSWDADTSGKSSLLVFAEGETKSEILSFNIYPVGNQDQTTQLQTFSGDLAVGFQPLIRVLSQSLPGIKQAAGVRGELQGQWRLQLGDKDWSAAGEINLNTPGGKFGKQSLPQGNLTGKFTADSHKVKTDFELAVANQAVKLHVNAEHWLDTNKGKAAFKLIQAGFSEQGFKLSRVIDDWSLPFDITAGRLAVEGMVKWANDLAAHTVILFDNLGGRFKQTAIAGVNGELALVYRNGGLQTSKDAQIYVGMIDVGFPIENLHTGFALESKDDVLIPTFRLKNFQTDILGGKIRIEPFVFDPARDKNRIVVKLEKLALEKIMALEKQKGLSGNGLLDGWIPVDITAKSFVVEDGKLDARKPGGVIRYSPDPGVTEMAKSNMSVDMLIKVLKDFHYQTLGMRSDYKPNGDLVLHVQLAGRNPGWQKGQPVNLNLNLQENIPALLRSLQLTNDIGERMSEYYGKTSAAGRGR